MLRQVHRPGSHVSQNAAGNMISERSGHLSQESLDPAVRYYGSKYRLSTDAATRSCNTLLAERVARLLAALELIHNSLLC